ncbi:methyltransferase domain-containing protein [Kordia sp. YSTF-M3]|uniref:Methyltransferase domain-containing protein n=1 Tax=Kordia aestuariivivens TaxID=2759037 RepID=A0ABR7Q7M6_9FLAO|nr:methyltransferase domain-containing protein [Kordia aestuariivivens]MBC8754324.1 methyltransferase domain-containing protein [Kordia aestuariivivens]
MNSASTEEYWSQRYKDAQTGWDIGSPSTPLKEYIDQLTDKNLKILIPGAGNAYEAEYLFEKGFTNVFILDISEIPLQEFQQRNPKFPSENLLCGDFFQHNGNYDLILEQTFFCSFPPLPATRKNYAKQMSKLLRPTGKIVGLWFDFPLTGDLEKRPFGGSKEEYLSYLEPYFNIHTFEKAYNSIPPRAGNELFGIFVK